MSDTDYLNQIQQLVDLQKVDDEIHEVKSGLENAPRELEELRQRLEQEDEGRNHVIDKLSHLQEQKKRLSLEIDDDSARIKKSKNKMTQVSNQREYQAMVREMDHMEKSNRTREEERLTLLDELETQNEAFKEIDARHAALKKEMDEKTASMEAMQAAAKDRLAVLNSQRTQFSAGIPRPIFQRYEFIRERLEHPVIVSVRNGVCTGCHVAIPPQDFIELQTGQQILSCPNCQRLIFWSEHFEDGSEESAQTQAASGARKTVEQNEWPEDRLKGEGVSEDEGMPWKNGGMDTPDDSAHEAPAKIGHDEGMQWPEDRLKGEGSIMKPDADAVPWNSGKNDAKTEGDEN